MNNLINLIFFKKFQFFFSIQKPELQHFFQLLFLIFCFYLSQPFSFNLILCTPYTSYSLLYALFVQLLNFFFIFAVAFSTRKKFVREIVWNLFELNDLKFIWIKFISCKWSKSFWVMRALNKVMELINWTLNA